MNKTKVKVLVVEDDEDDFIILKHYLSKIPKMEYDVYWANSEKFIVQDILANEHDIYLIDNYLGKLQGIDIIEKVRKERFQKPLILLTGAKDISVDEKAMEKGASDFLVKTELKIETLERSLRYALDRYYQQQFINNQERKYRSLFELSMEPLMILDDGFMIIEYNHAFQQMFSSFLINKNDVNFESLFEYDFDFDSICNKLQRFGFISGFKTVLKGEVTPYVSILSVAKLPAFDKDEKLRYQVAIHDISKLIETQKELQKLEKLSMTGRMARMIAHEVRNPLTNIQLALNELDELTKESPDTETYKEMIGRNAKRINSLINELLKSAKPQELVYSRTNLQAVMDSAIDFCSDRFKLQNIQFEKKYPDHLILGKWDPEKLKIAFVNILINATEALDETDSPQISVHVAQENNNPVIFIKDNGKGMNEETLNNLFDPFFTNRKDGLGLGMTETLNIIHMHKGKIGVQSKLGEGTIFKIEL